jgi:hypothetical protein
MKKSKLLTFTALATLLLMSLMVFSASATTVPTFTLSASSNQLQYYLPAGTIFNGTIETTGEVQFWVSAPNYNEIVNLGIVDQTTSFGFVAPQNGTYTMNFNEDMGNSVSVTFSYTTNPVLPGSNISPETTYIYLIITIVIAVLGSIIVILIIRRINKTQTSNVKNKVSFKVSFYLFQ